MKIFVVLVLLVLSPLAGVVTKADENFAAIDDEMIQLLALNEDQALAYLEIIGAQRQHFLTLGADDWQRELAIYQETYSLLEPVLNAEQHALFVGIVNSVIERPAN